MDFIASEFSNAKFWVAVALVLFLLLLTVMGVPKLLGGLLDKRAEEIKHEIEEAQRLREEAQALLASYERKQKEAEQEAEEIIEQAKKEAEMLKQETKKSMQELTERRTKLAEQKIAQAEASALKEVRTVAASVAIGAAETVLNETLVQSDKMGLIDASISDLKTKLN